MKLVIEISKIPTKDDILIYDGKEFIPIKKEQFLNDLALLKKEYQQEIEELKEEYESFKKGVNEKLKSYHDILQVLTKGE